MMYSGDLMPSYGWALALTGIILALILLIWRTKLRKQRRSRQRVRRLARQRAWDWLMMRKNVRALTYQPDEDQD